MKYGHSPLYAGYDSKAHQAYIYSQAMSLIKEEIGAGFSILDFGSGYGALLKFLGLVFEDKKIEYLGVDKNRKCADAATLKYGEFFVNTSFESFKWQRQFDYGFCLGTLSGEDFTGITDLLMSHVRKSIVFEVPLSHPFLEAVNDEMQIHKLRKYSKIDGVRFTPYSLIWKVNK